MKAERARFLYETLAPKRRTRVVDIGANPIGETPYSTLLENGLCDVWGFEPQEAAYEKLISDKGNRETYLPYAIGDGNRATLRICGGGGFTSLYEPNAEFLTLLGRWHTGLAVKDRVELETHRLDDLKEVPEFDLLKIDIQGGELNAFTGARTKLNSAIAVITEVAVIPIYEQQPLLDAQMAELRKSNFFFHKFLFLKSYMAGLKYGVRLRNRRMKNQAVDGDAVFLKDLYSLASVDQERLKHLALLADAVFESYDIVVLALEILEQKGAVGGNSIERYLALLPDNLTKAI